jgi:hypothetical protein
VRTTEECRAQFGMDASGEGRLALRGADWNA